MNDELTSPAVAAEETWLTALVVAPGVFTRNRHYAALSSGPGKRARLRAKVLRGVLAHLLQREPPAQQVYYAPIGEAADIELRYVIGRVSYARTLRMSAFEARLLQYVVARQTLPQSAEIAAEHAYFQQRLARLLQPSSAGM